MSLYDNHVVTMRALGTAFKPLGVEIKCACGWIEYTSTLPEAWKKYNATHLEQVIVPRRRPRMKPAKQDKLPGIT